MTRSTIFRKELKLRIEKLFSHATISGTDISMRTSLVMDCTGTR